jgi:transforming growth factor-beta-induced protein
MWELRRQGRHGLLEIEGHRGYRRRGGIVQDARGRGEGRGTRRDAEGEGPFTVFAPTDRAFEALPAGTVEALLGDVPALTKILTYHVVPGRLAAGDVLKSNWLKTVQGQSLLVHSDEGGARIDNARIIKTDIQTSNGVIHVIDAVVLPRKDIVDTAAEAGSFETLLAAAQAAGLAEVLKSEGPFTVFAPADSAFAKLPEGTIAALLKDKAALAKILKYHVVPGRVLSSDLPMKKIAVATVEGGKLHIEKSDAGVRVNGARVVKADIVAGNGIIHVVDSVILPK